MNTLLLEHFAAVSKVAAARQSRERQQGVDCSQGHLGSMDAGLLFDGPRTLECFFKYIPDSSPQFPIALSTSMMCFELSPSNVIRFFCGTSSLETPIVSNQDYHATISYDGSTAQAYLNGALVGTITPKAYAVASSFRIGHVSYPPKGPVYFARIFNYALSAKEVAALYNNGDPAGYVLPDAMKGLIPIEVVGNNYYTWTGESDPYYYVAKLSDKIVEGGIYKIVITVANYEKGEPFCKLAARSTTPIPAANGTYEIYQKVVGEPYNRYLSIYGGNNHTDRRFSITIESIERIGCIAEYVPQNIIISRKRDFPQVTLPIVGYTQSSGVFLTNSEPIATQVMNVPQANGFSGSYMRFDAVTSISLYCAYWYYYLKKLVPVKITFEYRANRTIYASQRSTAPTAPDAVAIDANEGDAQIASVIYGVGGSAYIFSAADTEAWLEMRVLAIEVVEDVCLGWLDSAKQLPLNGKYLPPLLETTGGYDLISNGTPEIIYKPTLIQVWQMLDPMTLNGLLPASSTMPQVVDGAIRITSNGLVNSYDGGGIFYEIIDAHVGDTIDFRFKAKANVENFKVVIGPSQGWLLFEARELELTTKYTEYCFQINNIENGLNSFWIAKRYEDNTPGFFNIKDIIIKVYK